MFRSIAKRIIDRIMNSEAALRWDLKSQTPSKTEFMFNDNLRLLMESEENGCHNHPVIKVAVEATKKAREEAVMVMKDPDHIYGLPDVRKGELDPAKAAFLQLVELLHYCRAKPAMSTESLTELSREWGLALKYGVNHGLYHGLQYIFRNEGRTSRFVESLKSIKVVCEETSDHWLIWIPGQRLVELYDSCPVYDPAKSWVEHRVEAVGAIYIKK